MDNNLILIVDDDKRNTFALSSYLETKDYRIQIAENGIEAIEMLGKGEHPTVILLDMMMPVMDGYETLDALAQSPSLRNIPVIAVTAKAMKGDREKCMAAGAWDYISKPIDLNELSGLLSKWTEKDEN